MATVFPLLRFIHLRRILRLAALTVPPSCGDDPRLFLFFLFFLFVYVWCNKWPLEAARPAAARAPEHPFP